MYNVFKKLFISNFLFTCVNSMNSTISTLLGFFESHLMNGMIEDECSLQVYVVDIKKLKLKCAKYL